jgi:hypothetical protein
MTTGADAPRTYRQSNFELRLGRLVVRRKRRYPHPVVYAVEWRDERDNSSPQLGAFSTEAAAQACIRRLESDGWADLYVNELAVHHRLDDWQSYR